MARNGQREVFRGRRRRVNVMGVVLGVIAACLVLLVVLFYSFQKYIVYSQDGISLELPILSTAVPVDDDTGERVFEYVPVELEYGEADYSSVEATAGEDLEEMRALFVPAQYVSRAGVERFISLMGTYNANALVLELKPVSGQLVWESESFVSQSYLTGGELDLLELAEYIHGQGIYLAGQLSCGIDALMAERAPSTALKNSFGSVFTNAEGSWVDLYNPTIRQYISELCAELSDMGFDEVILKSAAMPMTTEAVSYTVTLSTDPSPKAAVCGFAKSVTQSLSGGDMKISAILDAESFRGGGADISGQDVALFGKVFDRLCCYSTTAWQYGVDRDSASRYLELGEVSMRFLPIMAYAPEDADCYMVHVPEALVG